MEKTFFSQIFWERKGKQFFEGKELIYCKCSNIINYGCSNSDGISFFLPFSHRLFSNHQISISSLLFCFQRWSFLNSNFAKKNFQDSIFSIARQKLSSATLLILISNPILHQHCPSLTLNT